MDVNYQGMTKPSIWQGLLRWLNLRPEEGERTWLMFAFYTTTTIGLSWLDNSTAGLFVDRYGAVGLPLVYLCNAALGSLLGFFYSWMQRTIPLRQAIVIVPILIALPLVVFRVGLGIEHLAALTIFVVRLWLDVTYVLNDINTSITANQLFNIREIKRTYPLISSGVLVADVISGFSLPLMLRWVGLPNVILLSAVMIAVGGGILFYLGRAYQQAFPDAPSRFLDEGTSNDASSRRFQGPKGPIGSYTRYLVLFFVLAQILVLLIEFQFLNQLELQNEGSTDVAGSIASFLGVFNGILGLAELVVQWLLSSRAIERFGLFRAAGLQPLVITVVGLFSLLGSVQFGGSILSLYMGAITIKFADELLRYTLFASTGPVLFQPVPESYRGALQAQVRGVYESLSTGLGGLVILGSLWLINRVLPGDSWFELKSWVFGSQIVVVSLLWLVVVWAMRSRYVNLLVLSAERGRLGVSEVDSGALRSAIIASLNRASTSEQDKRSCIQLLSRIDPENVSEVLAPLLTSFPSALQRQSLEVMLQHPSPEYLTQVRMLIVDMPPPAVLAVALRYLWLMESEEDVSHLQPYLRTEVDPMVRGTAASLIMRRGTPSQKAEATNSLRRMLTSKDVQERVMGCRALGEAEYLQALRLHIPNLLQDESLEVRCALLEVIASARLEEYYPSLLRGLNYKATREAAMRGLIRLHNEAIPMLVQLGEDPHKPDLMRMHAWTTLGQIATTEALDSLIWHLLQAWGTERQNLLKILLKVPDDRGIEGVLARMGRSGLEILIDQELVYSGQLCAAWVDLAPERLPGREADLLRQALVDSLKDAQERLFLLMRYLYPLNSIQAASFNLESSSRENVARGLEILDNTLDIQSKRSLLGLLDGQNPSEKLRSLQELLPYQPLQPRDRVRRLVDLRHFLSDWPLACCFHLARQARWSLTTDQTLACLRHPRGFVREAVLSYLKLASQRTLIDLLPRLQHDPDRLVAAQVRHLMAEFGIPPADDASSGQSS